MKYSVLFSVLVPLTSWGNPFAGIQFHSTEDTLQTVWSIIKSHQKGAYLRFGDGDIMLANGHNDSYQQTNYNLQKEMRAAFAINGETVIKALPLHCPALNSIEAGMFPGNHASNNALCAQLLSLAQPFWGQKVTHVYSTVALHFLATTRPEFCIDFLHFLKNEASCILVGNQDIPSSLRTALFGQDCIFIPTPSRQSYTEINRIEQDCLTASPSDGCYRIIITAMGCSGRVLQKRLWYKLNNVFLFDFGSLMDALCGWDTRAWISLSGFNAQHFIQKLTE